MTKKTFVKMIIFSSGENVKPGGDFAKKLRKYAKVQLWLNAFREYTNKDLRKALERILSAVDYAVFILTPDGRPPEQQLGSQKNLMFELGVAMTKLGPENVFIICDSKADVPAYLQSIVLTFYDGSDPKALSVACKAITDKVAAAQFGHLSGEWISKYRLHFKAGKPLAVERVTVVGLESRIKIISDQNPLNDNYVAIPWFDASNRHFVGYWKSKDSGREGWYALYLSECEKMMYGRYTGRDEGGRKIEADWVLAKNDAGEEEIAARLAEAERSLPAIIRLSGTTPRPGARRALLSLKAKANKINSKLLGLFMTFWF